MQELHRRLFAALDAIPSASERAARFEDYLTVHFRLDQPEAMGHSATARVDRHKSSWLRVLRGWMFDSDSIDAAVLKAWVESRFGLLPRYHRAPLRSPGDAAWLAYEEDRSRGLYGTSGLEAQFDLLFEFGQYEFRRARHPVTLALYRGINRSHEFEKQVTQGDAGEVWLLNSLNSFSGTADRASEFGDVVIRCEVPCAKVLAYSGLLPSRLQGEDEYLVIGGLYRVHRES